MAVADRAGQPFTNTAMLGALIAISELVDLEAVLKGLNGFLRGAVLQKNIEVVTKVFEQCIVAFRYKKWEKIRNVGNRHQAEYSFYSSSYCLRRGFLE